MIGIDSGIATLCRRFEILNVPAFCHGSTHLCTARRMATTTAQVTYQTEYFALPRHGYLLPAGAAKPSRSIAAASGPHPICATGWTNGTSMVKGPYSVPGVDWIDVDESSGKFTVGHKGSGAYIITIQASINVPTACQVELCVHQDTTDAAGDPITTGTALLHRALVNIPLGLIGGPVPVFFNTILPQATEGTTFLATISVASGTHTITLDSLSIGCLRVEARPITVEIPLE